MKKIIINAGKIGLINIFTNFYLIHTPLEINYMTFIQALTFPDHSEVVNTSVLYCLYPKFKVTQFLKAILTSIRNGSI